MMPMKCRSCKHYCTVYKPLYHGTVEGCGCNTNEPYPTCYRAKEKEDSADGSVANVQ